MTQLIWDNVGERSYETGLDRGVLFTADGTAVVWNGLTSLTEDESDITVTSYYIDGVKYLDSRSSRDFSASLKAFTYPDEFLPYDGYQITELGIYVPDQPVTQTFNLSYRTMLGNDLDPLAGYRIHFLYNLTAKADSKSYSSNDTLAKPLEFSWSLTGVPVQLAGYRPVVHLFIDTNNLEDYQIEALEEYLYGTDTTDPIFPQPDDLGFVIGSASAPSFLFDGGDPADSGAPDIVFDGGTP